MTWNGTRRLLRSRSPWLGKVRVFRPDFNHPRQRKVRLPEGESRLAESIHLVDMREFVCGVVLLTFESGPSGRFWMMPICSLRQIFLNCVHKVAANSLLVWRTYVQGHIEMTASHTKNGYQAQRRTYGSQSSRYVIERRPLLSR